MRTLLKEFLSSELVSTASEDQLALVVGRAAARKVRARYRAWGSDSLGGQVPQSGFPQTNALRYRLSGRFWRGSSTGGSASGQNHSINSVM